MEWSLSGCFKQVWKNQKGVAITVDSSTDIGGREEILFKVPEIQGRQDEVRNMAYVHRHCQRGLLERRAKARDEMFEPYERETLTYRFLDEKAE